MVCKRKQDQLKRKLSAHHVDYDKDNLDPDNFVSLCMSCHCATSDKKNRSYWTKVFQKIVEMNKVSLL